MYLLFLVYVCRLQLQMKFAAVDSYQHIERKACSKFSIKNRQVLSMSWLLLRLTKKRRKADNNRMCKIPISILLFSAYYRLLNKKRLKLWSIPTASITIDKRKCFHFSLSNANCERWNNDTFCYCLSIIICACSIKWVGAHTALLLCDTCLWIDSISYTINLFNL